MFHSKILIQWVRPFAFGLAVILASQAWATDEEATKNFTDAKALYAERTDAAKLESMLGILTVAETQAVSADLKYDIMILASKGLYFKAFHETKNSDKIEGFEKGRAKAEAARSINADTDNYAEAYYWEAANLGRWGEFRGVVQSLFKVATLQKLAGALPDKVTRDGQPGETYEGNGASRITGRLLFKLPGFAGGSLEDSLKNLQTAYDNAKNYALNTLWYAESLASGTGDEKRHAKEILDDLLKGDPQTLNPDRIPETVEEFAEAKKLRAQLGN